MKRSYPWLGFGGSGTSDRSSERPLGAESEDWGMCVHAGEGAHGDVITPTAAGRAAPLLLRELPVEY